MSGYVGVYDLSGNVWEWEDSCDGTTGSNDLCRLRGGSFGVYPGDYLRCDYGGYDGFGARVGGLDIGLRCCSP